MSFQETTQVRFAHVDPAGIVFYPRYFEMLNGVVEDWFARMGLDFITMHMKRRIGVPTVKLETEFLMPSRLGDQLVFTLRPTVLGRTSCTFEFKVECGEQLRFRGTGVLVCVDLDGHKAIEWPDDLRIPLLEQCVVEA